MIESLMLCGIGLLAGCLLMLDLFPAVHGRAVRLTRRDLIDAAPLTAKEMQAEKDQLRAQFAVSLRRLELNLEQMRGRRRIAPPTGRTRNSPACKSSSTGSMR
jgi:hypothetical protein